MKWGHPTISFPLGFLNTISLNYVYYIYGPLESSMTIVTRLNIWILYKRIRFNPIKITKLLS